MPSSRILIVFLSTRRVIVSPSDTPTTLHLRSVSAAMVVSSRVSRRRIGMGLGMVDGVLALLRDREIQPSDCGCNWNRLA